MLEVAVMLIEHKAEILALIVEGGVEAFLGKQW